MKKTSLLLTVGVLVLFFSALCKVSSPILSPIPPELRAIEGYAALKIFKNQDSAKSRLSFLFELPAQARIEVIGPLGRTVSEVLISENNALFILPSKRVYWQGTKEEVLENLLGFRLSLQEMARLLSGDWQSAGIEEEPFRGWSLKRDAEERIISGDKEDFHFEVKDFFVRSFIPRLLFFRSLQSAGSLKILSIDFNKPIKSGVFNASFLKDFIPMKWEEIEKLLGNEN